MVANGRLTSGRPKAGEEGMPHPELGAVARQYLEYVRVEKRLSERTLALYQLDLERLTSFAESVGHEVLLLQTVHIRRFVAQMHAQGRSGRGIALILSGWRGFYQWAAQQGLVPLNPVQGVRAPKQPKPLPKALGVDDAVQLAAFADAQGDPWQEARDAAMTELLYSSGLRVGELVGLNLLPSTQTQCGWVDMESAEAHVIGKGQRRRTVPIGKHAKAALERWLAVRSQPFSAQWQETALFVGKRGARMTGQSVWLALKQRGQQAGLAQPVHPHVLRHSFASHVLQSSGDLRAVQELLGHANIATTQIYTRLDFQHLAKAYESAHPRAKRKD